MRKNLLLLLALTLISGVLWSQKITTSQYDITLNGKTIANAANFSKVKGNMAAKYGTKAQGTLGIFILQFNNIPTSKEKDQLKTQGVELLGYVHSYAYYARLSAKFLASSSKGQENLRAIYDILPEYKISPELTTETIPEYAIVSEGTVKVVVGFFKGSDVAQMKNDLSTISARNERVLNVFSQILVDIPLKNLYNLAEKEWVQNIQLPEAPADFNNRPGRTLSRSNVLNSKITGLGYDLTGKGVKMGIWDGNVEPHKDFGTRLNTREFEYLSSHGEHTTGSIASAGVLDPWAKGMAPEVEIYAWNFNTQSNGLPVYEERYKSALEDGIEITSNSFGVNVTACPSTTKYGTSDQGDDLVTNLIPYLLNVYSNGNNQSVCTGGYNTSSKNSKNALHVAAIDGTSNMSTFSSFGPTIDGRLVPQVSNFGVDVWSTSYNNGYELMSGTSMATPTTTGTAVLLIEAYKKKYNDKPLASLLKAIISNTARDLGNVGPDYKFGYGEVNGLRAVEAIEKNQFFTGNIEQGQTITKNITIPTGAVAANIMIAWSDKEAIPGVAKILTNNIDLKVTSSGNTYLPWLLDPNNPANPAGKGVDNINNVEQVTINYPAAGTYTIVLEGMSIPEGPQEYSVTYDIIYPNLRLTYPIGNEILNPGTTEIIRWESYGYNDTYTLQYSIDGGSTYITIADNIASNVRSYAWSVPTATVSSAKVRLVCGSMLSESKAPFAIMKTPVLSLLGNDITWTAIPNAKYEVYKLNGYIWELKEEVTTNSYSTSAFAAGEEHFVAVVAVDNTTGVKSERSVALQVIPCQTISAFPITENFNTFNSYIPKFSFNINTGLASVTRLTTTNAYAMLQGSGTSVPSTWSTCDATTAFTLNPSFIKTMSICGIDATTLAGQKLRLAFDMKLALSTTNRSFFRLKVNGTPVANTSGSTVYSTAVSTFTTVYYDLTAYAGTTFSLTWEAVGPLSTDYTQIDNIQLGVPVTDAAITSLTPNTGYTATETVTIKVKNLSGDPISNIPVTYIVNEGALVSEIISGPIAALAEATYSFTQKADYTTPGSYTVVATVNLTDDVVAGNNSISKTIVNPGSSGIIMGVSATTQTTCDAYLYDNGGLLGNYSNSATNTMLINPGTANSNVKVTFEAFDVETGYDFLYIYNGTSTSAPLLATLSGNSLPASYTSTADGGQLYFRFTSDSDVNGAGFVAKLSCEPKPTSDAGIVSISTPPYIIGNRTNTETIKITVKNYGTSGLTDLEVFYQINGGSKVVEIIPSLASLASTTYTFATTADLSTSGIAYTLKAGINQPDENIANNELTRELKPIEPFTHTNTDSYGIIKFTINGVEKSSGVTAYSDYKTIEVPLYKGLTYSPTVFTNIPQQPISGSVSSSTYGSFSIIIIDLNGDGNLADEFAAGSYWVNTLTTTTSPYTSTKTLHYFRNYSTSVSGLIVPTSATNGKQLMRVINMYRRPSEAFNPYLGPTYDGSTTSSADFEVEDYTVDIKTQPTGDVGISAISQVYPAMATNTSISATITNYSSVAISNFDVAYTINGGAEVVQTYTASIAANGTGTITFTTRADLMALGTTYNIEVYTKLTGDEVPSNDKKTTAITTPNLSTTNVVGTFETGNTIATGSIANQFSLTNNFTVEMWIKPQQNPGYGTFFSKGMSIIHHSLYYPAVYGSNCLIISLGGQTYLTPSNSITNDVWQHIAVTSATDGTINVYVNGVQQTLSNSTKATQTANLTTPVRLGSNSTYTQPYYGAMDEVRIWNSERSQSTIAGEMSTSYPTNTSGLFAYYKFAEGNSNVVYDYSSNDNTAIVSNAVVIGTGTGKFWNIPDLTPSFSFDEQIATPSYNPATKTFTAIVNTSASITNLAAKFNDKYGVSYEVSGVPQVSGVTTNDFTNLVTYTVKGVGINAGYQEDYFVKVYVDGASQNNLISYSFTTANNPQLQSDITLAISGEKAYAKVPFGTDVKSLKATFTNSAGAEVQIGGVTQVSPQASSMDYSKPIVAKVLADNKVISKLYEVFVDARNAEAAFTSYSVPDQVGTAIIDNVNKTVKVFVKNYSSFNNVVPTFTVSENAKPRINNILQTSGNVAMDFTQPVSYIIESEDGEIFNTWIVSIENDVVKPVITLNGSTPASVTHHGIYTDAGAVANDNAEGDISSRIVVNNPVNTEVLGQYTITYNVTDAAGNAANEVTRTVNVVAKLVSAITVSGTGNATTITTNGGTLQMIADVTPSNATNATVTWSVTNGTGEATINATGLLTASKNGTVTVKATAKDGSNIEGTLVITISNQGTGIETAENAALSIYPNPVTNAFKVKYSDKWDRLDVYNSIGVIVKSVKYSERIDVADLSSGIYVVNFYNKEGNRISIVRFVKQ